MKEGKEDDWNMGQVEERKMDMKEGGKVRRLRGRKMLWRDRQ